MQITGTFTVPAPRARVWQALNDPEILRQCIPGCEELTRVGDNEFEGKVVAKVGPVKASFAGRVTLADLDPPNGYTIQGEGKGGVAGFAKGSAKVSLHDDPGGTRLDYTADASVGGKLAQIGGRLIEAAANQTAEGFFAKFSALVTAGGANDAQPAAADGAPSAPAAAPDAPASMLDKNQRLLLWAAAGVILVAIVIFAVVL